MQLNKMINTNSLYIFFIIVVKFCAKLAVYFMIHNTFNIFNTFYTR